MLFFNKLKGAAYRSFFFLGHTSPTPESSRYTPKGFRRISTSTELEIQALSRAAATAAGGGPPPFHKGGERANLPKDCSGFPIALSNANISRAAPIPLPPL